MFVDVHDKVLFYCVCGWEEGFAAGYVIEYGTLPQQARAFFTLQSATRTLGRAFAGAGAEGAVQAGLEKLVSTYLAHDFRRGEGLMRIDRLLVDMGWEPTQGIIAAVKHKVGGTAMMISKGVGIRASRRPMSTWKRRPGEQHGHYWCIPNVSRSREFPHVLFDANHWKTFVHTALATAPGDRGNLTLFGRPADHELFARHVAETEQWVDVQALGRTVREWSPRPAKPDNHWLDCLVGCAVAASLAGIRSRGADSSCRSRKRYTQKDLTRHHQLTRL